MISTRYNCLGIKHFYPADYTQIGLVCHYDSYFNMGNHNGIIHDNATNIWYDCSGNGNHTQEDERTNSHNWSTKGLNLLTGATVANSFLLNPIINTIFKDTTSDENKFGCIEICASLHSDSNS